MTAEWFDLGQRLRAAHTRQPQPRLLHAPITPASAVVAVRATERHGAVHVTAASLDAAARTATGTAALDLLASLGATLDNDTPPALVTDQPDALALLWRLSLTVAPDSPHAPAAAHLAWARDRADFPGGRAVVDTTAACRTRWVTGLAPQAETNPAVWRTWLGITDADVTGVLAVYQRLTDTAPLVLLDALAEDDLWAHGAARRERDTGWDWRRPDTTARAALGLRSRCDAADLFAAALLTDPLHRLRATHTGHVVTGSAVPLGDKLRRVEVTSTRLDARLRPGNDVTGWVGPPTAAAAPFSGTVTGAAVRGGQHLVLTLSGVTGAAPALGQQVTLHPAPPSVHRQRSGRRSYRALYAARRSWLTTGRTPTPTRREVPLDVLVAGAEPD